MQRESFLWVHLAYHGSEDPTAKSGRWRWGHQFLHIFCFWHLLLEMCVSVFVFLRSIGVRIRSVWIWLKVGSDIIVFLHSCAGAFGQLGDFVLAKKTANKRGERRFTRMDSLWYCLMEAGCTKTPVNSEVNYPPINWLAEPDFWNINSNNFSMFGFSVFEGWCFKLNKSFLLFAWPMRSDRYNWWYMPTYQDIGLLASSPYPRVFHDGSLEL